MAKANTQPVKPMSAIEWAKTEGYKFYHDSTDKTIYNSPTSFAEAYARYLSDFKLRERDAELKVKIAVAVNEATQARKEMLEREKEWDKYRRELRRLYIDNSPKFVELLSRSPKKESPDAS